MYTVQIPRFPSGLSSKSLLNLVLVSSLFTLESLSWLLFSESCASWLETITRTRTTKQVKTSDLHPTYKDVVSDKDTELYIYHISTIYYMIVVKVTTQTFEIRVLSLFDFEHLGYYFFIITMDLK